MHKRLNRFSATVFLATSTAAAILASPFAQAFDLNEAMLNNSTPYSATQTMTSGKKGRDSFTAQTYREGQKIRLDISESGQEISVVMRLDDGKNLLLMHEMSMYQAVDSKRVKQYQSSVGGKFTNQQKLGKETVNGYSATKYSADFEDEDGQKGSGLFWVTDDDIVIRGEWQLQRRRRVEEATFNLTNLKIGDQPDELFEAPANYQSLGLGSLFGNAMRQNRNNAPVSDQERAQDPEYAEPDAEQPAAEDQTSGQKARKALGRLFGRGKDNN